MKKIVNKKKCNLCQLSTDVSGVDILRYGDWQTKSGLTVHYFCLLLSTNLPQRGSDNCGILGFLLKDIRTEIRAAAERRCVFCNKTHASISCKNCKDYFHLICGERQDCLFHFYDEFITFCEPCSPLEEKHKQNLNIEPSMKTLCYICHDSMGKYSPVEWIHANCCGNGYVHRLCLQEYALSAGYYLICIWCKDKSFRGYIRTRGVFVPDRDANWERQKNAYIDLYKGHSRCDMPRCLCPRGRDYTKFTWPLILCSFCGSFGAHNPTCIPGMSESKIKTKEFKCETCSYTEKLMKEKQMEKNLSEIDSDKVDTNKDILDVSIYILKTNVEKSPIKIQETIDFTDQENLSPLNSSCVTAILRKPETDMACLQAYKYGLNDLVSVYSETQSNISENSELYENRNLLETDQKDSCARTRIIKYERNSSKDNVQHLTEEPHQEEDSGSTTITTDLNNVETDNKKENAITNTLSTKNSNQTKEQQNSIEDKEHFIATNNLSETQETSNETVNHQVAGEGPEQLFTPSNLSVLVSEKLKIIKPTLLISQIGISPSTVEINEIPEEEDENLETTVIDSCARTTYFKYIRKSIKNNIQHQPIVEDSKTEDNTTMMQPQHGEVNEEKITSLNSTQNATNRKATQKISEKDDAKLPELQREEEMDITIPETPPNQDNLSGTSIEEANRNLFYPSPEEISTNQPNEITKKNYDVQILNDNIRSDTEFDVATYFNSESAANFDAEPNSDIDHHSINDNSTQHNFYYFFPQDQEFVDNLREIIPLTKAVTLSQNDTLPINRNFQSSQEHIGIFEVYTIDKDTEDVLQRCRALIDFQDPRFAGKSLQEIRDTPGLLNENDIIRVYNDIGIFEEINDIIAKDNLRS